MRINTFLSLLLLLLAPAVQAAVLAIDYGAEFTKLSLVKPGVALDVVLDKDSKRKIQSVVSWKRDDRVFGAEAKAAASRFPEAHYPYIKPILGSDQLPELPLYPNPPQISDDGSIIFKHPSQYPLPDSEGTETWSPTALLAHQLSYFRSLAEHLAGTNGKPETITQVIATVPGWWNQFQRRAYRDALELQGLTCLAMIGEGTGVALNYAMTRQFPDFDPKTGSGDKEYHLIYDSGALQTTATVVSFWQQSYYPTPKSKKPINTTFVDVISNGHQEIGGVVLDLKVRDLLLEDFIAKSKKDAVRNEKRALAKLDKEANRVKHILSANQESNVNVESLYDDVDYRSKLSREQLEDTLAEASTLFSEPIAAALDKAGLTLDNITSVIFFGGNTRVPFVQSAVKSVLGDAHSDKIAQNVNTDEAAVLGAAYYGAGLSRQFKMKSLDVLERSNEEFTVEGEVFLPQGSGLGQKKAITLPAKENIKLEFAEGGKPILLVETLNVPAALANFTGPEPVINLTMRLDARGYLATANAVLVSNATEGESSGGVAGALKGLFGKKEKEEKEDDEDLEATNATKKEDKTKKKPEKVVIRFKEHHLGVKPSSGEEKRKIMSRLSSISSSEAGKAAREEARNVLEGYLYKLSSLLDPDTDRRALIDFSTETERDALTKIVAQSFDWLADHAETASEKELRAKRQAIEKLEEPIVMRFNEWQTRGKAIEDFQQAMLASRTFYTEAQKNVTAALEAAKDATPEKPVAPPKYTQDELKSVEDMMKDNEVWIDGLMAEQVKLEGDKTRDPVIFTKDLVDRGKRLQATVLRLINKKAPKAPKPVKPTTSSSTTAEEATASTADQDETTKTSTSTESTSTPIVEETNKHDEL